MLEVLSYVRTREVKQPTRGTDEAAGIDFYIPTNLDDIIVNEKCKTTGVYPACMFENGYLKEMLLSPGDSVLLPSGIHVTLPKGYCLKFENKSGVAAKKHLICGANIIDSDFEGEIHINVHNVGNTPITISAGEKIIQALIYKVELSIPLECASLESLYAGKNSARGTGGFGSTGTK